MSTLSSWKRPVLWRQQVEMRTYVRVELFVGLIGFFLRGYIAPTVAVFDSADGLAPFTVVLQVLPLECFRESCLVLLNKRREWER